MFSICLCRNSISQDSEGAPPTPLREEELKREIAELNVKLQQLSEANIVLSAQNSSMSSSIPPLTYSSIKGSKYVHYYTGLNEETYEQLMLWLLRFELQYAQKWQVVNVGKEDQLLLTMMKLRCNFDFTDLAFRFQVSRTTVSNIFHTWLQALHEVLFVPFLNKIPSTRKNKESLPASFSDSKFTCCRIVVDCTEMACVMSRTSMDSNSRTFSNYKHRHTFKFLIGCSPGGVITFVSDAYPGNTSDKKIFGDCGLTDQLVAGDMVLVDKGFMVNDLVPQGVSVNIPPLLVGKQFTRQEVKLTYEIARARIIIERVNERVKNYNILDKFPTYLRPHASQILQVVCALVNFQNPLIADTQECEKDEAEIGAEEENENNNVQ